MMQPNQAEIALNQELTNLNSSKMGRRLFLASLSSLLAACATGEKTRMREGDNAGQNTHLSVQDELKMTQEYLPQMTKEYPLVKNQYAQSYISELGNKIVLANNLNNNPYQYRFSLVDSKSVNAFALPAGEVFVTVPLFKMAESEAELAGVIGHEIGHIQARHTAERMYQAKKAEKKTMLYGIGGAVLGGAAGILAGKKLCKKEDKECLTKALKYATLAGAGGALLIQKFAFMANSREDEMEADRIGFKTSVKAGYDKNHVGLFYEKLLIMEQQSQGNQNKVLTAFSDAMSTHPPSKERVKQMQEMAMQLNAAPGQINSPDFFNLKKRL
jgi:beta-barrel assembly-enhancing protease